jgi:hypothetical protein
MHSNAARRDVNATSVWKKLENENRKGKLSAQGYWIEALRGFVGACEDRLEKLFVAPLVRCQPKKSDPKSALFL